MGNKRKCGVVSLSDDRLWQTREQINNTPHLSVYIRTIYNNTSNERCVIPVYLKFTRFSAQDETKHFHQQYVRYLFGNSTKIENVFNTRGVL